MKRILRAGTRKSLLAMEQTRLAVKAINERYPDIEVQICGISTKGDRNIEKPLGQLGGKGVFVSEIERLIASGEIDFAVHSGKDLPAELYDGLEISSVLSREDRRDVLVTMKDSCLLMDERYAGVIGTGSGRRIMQGKRLIPDCQFRLIRGNINTRLEKLEKGQYDGVILAAAGLKRLGLYGNQKFFFRAFSEEEMIPAACQGIIVLESKCGSDASKLLGEIQSPVTRKEYEWERQILKLLGGDCSTAIGASVRYENGTARALVMYGESRTDFEALEESFSEEAKCRIKILEDNVLKTTCQRCMSPFDVTEC